MRRNKSKQMLAVAILITLFSISAGGIETIEHCDTMTVSGHSLGDNHTIPLFDPALGNLFQVDMTLDLEVEQNYSLENTEPAGQTADARSESILQVTLPDESTVSVNASSSVSEELAPYDGQTDFEGSSGKTIEGVESRGSKDMQKLRISDFVASVQNETISLPGRISIRSETSGNIAFSLSTVAESNICVTYTYEPKGS